METNVIFDRRKGQGMFTSADPVVIWSGWRGSEERWLFLAPHDDDIVIGAGLTFLTGLHLGVDVHAGIISNGRMGYCTPEQRDTIKQVRKNETCESFRLLGMPDSNLYQFDYDDGNLMQQSGRRFANDPNDPCAIAGAVGLQNTMTWLLRKVRPSRVFMPNRLDIHPDHRAVNADLLISVFHAQGQIWPELGPPITVIPKLYEYPTYNDFVAPPTMCVRVSDDLVEKRLASLALFKSQLQIEMIVNELRKSGGKEYLFEVTFEVFSTKKYESLFKV